MTLGGVHKVRSHGINQREVPGRTRACGRLQFGDSEVRPALPGIVADIVAMEVLQKPEQLVVDVRGAAQRRIANHQNRWLRPGRANYFVPADLNLRRLLAKTRGDLNQEQ